MREVGKPHASLEAVALAPAGVVRTIRIGVAAKDPTALHGLWKDFVTVERGRDYLVLKRK